MNNYRNWHYQTSNKIKHNVSDYLRQFDFPLFDKVSITYTLVFKDKVKRDIMNFVAVADKFILDHLVTIGSLRDDNYHYVRSYKIKPVISGDENKIIMEIEEIDK